MDRSQTFIATAAALLALALLPPDAADAAPQRRRDGRQIAAALEDPAFAVRMDALRAITRGEARPGTRTRTRLVQLLGSSVPEEVDATLDAISAVGESMLRPLADAPGNAAVPEAARLRAMLRLGDKGAKRVERHFQAGPAHPDGLRAVALYAEQDDAVRLLAGVLKRPEDAGLARLHLQLVRRRGPIGHTRCNRALGAARIDDRLAEIARDALLDVDPRGDAERLHAWLASGDPLRALSALASASEHAALCRDWLPELAAHLASEDPARVTAAALALRAAAPELVRHERAVHTVPGTSREAALLGAIARSRGGVLDAFSTAIGPSGGDGTGRVAPEEFWSFAPRWLERTAGAGGAPLLVRPPAPMRRPAEAEHRSAWPALCAARNAAEGADPFTRKHLGRALFVWREPGSVPALAAAAEVAGDREFRRDRSDALAYLWARRESLTEVPGIAEALAPVGALPSLDALTLLLALDPASTEHAVDALIAAPSPWTPEHFLLVSTARLERDVLARLDANSRARLAEGEFLHAAPVRAQGEAALPTLRGMLADERVDVRMVAVALARELGADARSLVPTLSALEEEGEAARFVASTVREIAGE